MKWNFDMESCPLDTKVRLLSGDGDLLLPRQEFIGTIVDNGRYRTRGECFKGDPEYFYRSAIVAWKPLAYEPVESEIQFKNGSSIKTIEASEPVRGKQKI